MEPGRISFDVKMSQIIAVTVRAQSINCKMVGALREEAYNFSMKMSIKEREFFSEHSANFQNLMPYQITGAGNTNEDMVDENYQMVMDENKKQLKAKYFDVRKTKKMPTDCGNKQDQETSETSKIEEESLILQLRTSKIVFSKAVSQRLSVAGPVGQWLPKKDVNWKYSDDCDCAPSLDVN